MSEKRKPLTPAEAKRELDRLFKFLLTHQMPMAPDPEPPALINIKSKGRLPTKPTR